MVRSRILNGLLLNFITLLFFFGCVEREEKIRVHEDGSADVSVLFKADGREELYPGRVPASGTGWNLTETKTAQPDGKIKYHLSAEKRFDPDAPLPNTYALDGSDDAHLHLLFPTDLVIEKRKNGTYYHFRRIYKKRGWARIALLEEIIPDNRLRGIMKKDPKELPLFERESLLRGMTEIELHKKLVFAREAYLEITPGITNQDGWLKLFNDVLDLRSSLDYQNLARRLGDGDASSDEALAEAADRFEQRISRSLRHGLRAYCDCDMAREEAFYRLYNEKERAYRLSEDIGGERFHIAIEMPGEIIGSNANRIDGSEAIWEFDGKALMDRDHELLISSRVSS